MATFFPDFAATLLRHRCDPVVTELQPRRLLAMPLRPCCHRMATKSDGGGNRGDDRATGEMEGGRARGREIFERTIEGRLSGRADREDDPWDAGGGYVFALAVVYVTSTMFLTCLYRRGTLGQYTRRCCLYGTSVQTGPLYNAVARKACMLTRVAHLPRSSRWPRL